MCFSAFTFCFIIKEGALGGTLGKGTCDDQGLVPALGWRETSLWAAPSFFRAASRVRRLLPGFAKSSAT